MADNFQYVQSIKHTLAGSGVTATATTIVLKSFQLPDGSTNITLSDFGTIGFGTLEPGTTREEVISFTGVTQNADGTADLTGVTRGLRFVSPYTTLAANRKAHSGGSIFVISNNPQHYDKLAGKDNDETILQTWTYNKFPVKSGGLTPTSADEFATKSYVDGVVGGSANFDQNLVAGNAGETLVAGDWVFLDEADQEWKKTDASASSTSEGVIIGVAQGAGVDAGAIANGVLIGGLEKGQSGLTPGAKQFLSDVAGTISGSAGTVEVFVGIANSATEVILAHNHTQETLTADEKDANAGNSGTPSASNLYVTELGFQRSVEVFAATATGNDTYVITLDPVPVAYVAGMTIRVALDVANTGAATIDVNSLGAKAITKNGTTALEDNDIRAGQVITLVFDGTRFILQGSAVVLNKANADTLTGGVSTDADALHTHDSLIRSKQLAFTNVDNAVGTSEVDLLSFTLTANDLGTNGMMRITVVGTASDGTSGFRINLDFGASAALVEWTKAGGSSGTEPFTYVIEIANRNDAAIQHFQGTVVGWNEESALNVFQSTATEDTTSNVTVVVRGQSITAGRLNIDRITVELLRE